MTAPVTDQGADADWKNAWIWWKRGIIYQVYPRSFQDSNGDGGGDLRGVLQRLDYLKWLNVDALWLSPFYPSPMKDSGYDISDYKAISPLFGTMQDFDELLGETHKSDMKLILDLVPNHTSDQHPWFQEAASSRDNPRRDWYIWSDPASSGGPPNNWLSEFAGSAWQWHEATGQYYYHAFLAEQPDLNWRNPDVWEAISDVMRFWLDKGVDGFRVDVMWHMVKDQQLRNNPPNPDYDPARDSPYKQLTPVFSTDQPEVHEVVRAMRKVIDEYHERLLIGEVYLPVEELVAYYGDEEKEAHLPFNFQLIPAPWDAAHIRQVVDTYEASLRQEDWPNWVLGNHDKPRLASRIGQDQARLAAVLLLTLRGTPTLYNGDELGMENVEIAPDQAMDPRELNCPGKGLGRDAERTPMQWNGLKNAGFTQGKPWLPVAPDYAVCNVERQRREDNSFLMLYHRLIQLRQHEPALAIGDYEPVPSSKSLFAYLRRHGTSVIMVLLNFSNTSQVHPALSGSGTGEVLLSTLGRDRDGENIAKQIELPANEGLIIRLAPASPSPPASAIQEGGN